MQMHINNQAMLNAGYTAGNSAQAGGWLPWSEAPCDGSIIEIRNAYGVVPTYSLGQWSAPKEQWGGATPRWHGVPNANSGWIEGSHLTWRHTDQQPDSYKDPTGGAQNSAAYWRGAVAAKYGLPADAFEQTVARNAAKNAEAETPHRKFLGIF